MSPDFAELIVEGALTIEGTAGQRAQLTTDPGPDNDGLWYGIRVLPGAQVEVQHAELTRTAFAFSGEIDAETSPAHRRFCGARKRRQRPAAGTQWPSTGRSERIYHHLRPSHTPRWQRATRAAERHH